MVSATLGGAALGSLSGGQLADQLGRRGSLLLAALPMLVGALLCSFAGRFEAMVAGRCGGLGFRALSNS